MWKRKQVLMDAATGEGGGGGAAAAAGAPEPSLLTAAVGATAPAAGTAPAATPAPNADDPFAWIPEKYRVPGAEGKPDVLASAQKINEARAALEKRMGEGGLPPETADGYKPDGALAALKEKTGKDVTAPPEMLKDFNAWAHEAKLSQAQYDKALTGFLGGGVQQMIDAAFDRQMATGKAELAKAWGPAEGAKFKESMTAAVKAFNAYAPAEMRTPAVMDAIGNHPVVLQLLAAVGKELREDKLPNGDNAHAGADIKTLQNSAAYWDAKHPEHASTVAKVNEYYAKGGRRPA